MKFSPVIKWMLCLATTAGVVGGGLAFRYWNDRHRLAQAELLKQFALLAPDLSLDLGRTQLNGLNRLTVDDIEIRERSSGQPLLRAESIVVQLDESSVLDGPRPVIQSVRVDGADILVVRTPDGRWNWQNYTWNLPAQRSGPLPLVDIRRMRVQLHLKHGDGIPSARLLLTSPQIQAVPVSAHQMDIEGTVDLAGTGQVRLSGRFDLSKQDWKLQGRLRDLTADRKLLDLARSTSPRVNEEVDRLRTAMNRSLPPLRTASRDDAALLIGPDIATAPRFVGRLDIDFDVTGGPDRPVPDFRLLVDVREGQISVPGIPLRLSDVRAEFFADNSSVVLRIRDAQCNNAALSGHFEMRGGDHVPEAVLKVTKFPIDSSLRTICPAPVRQLLDRFDPDFLLSGSGRIIRRPDGRWEMRQLNAVVTEGRIRHWRFRYPLTGITATLRQRPVTPDQPDVVVDLLEARGMAGDTPWTAAGRWINPGPATESDIVVSVSGFPLDDRFRAALEPKARQVVDALDVNGSASARIRFYRPPGLHRKTLTQIDARIAGGSVRFSRFPFRIEDISGRITFDSERAVWTFDDLAGRHGTASVQASGVYTGLPRPGVLDLTVASTHLALDADLYHALSPAHRRLWAMLDASGFCDTTAEIHWTALPGQPAVVRFPEATPTRIYDGRMRPSPFPYEMNVEEVVLSFDPNDPRYAGVQHCRIHSLRASHRGAPITARGHTEIDVDGLWRVHLDNLNADGLVPDDDLRSALPDSWEDTLSKLHPAGRVSLKDSELDFRGIADSPRSVTAAWNLKLMLHGCTFDAGTEVENVHGSVTARGNWDGQHLDSRGAIQLRQARILDLPLTRIQGPWELQDSHLVLGDQSVLRSRRLEQTDPRRRLKARLYGGTVFLDAIVDTRPGRGYIMFTQLDGMDLQRFAQDNVSQAGRMNGRVSAWLALQGEGDSAHDMKGRGEVEIQPAALYELPVIVELLSALSRLNFTVRDRTAFHYAKLGFTVGHEQFRFRQIDLIGESLALRGRGTVGFRGDLNLDFYSQPPRPAGPTIPFLNLLASGATQWARVRVRGTVQNPQTTIHPTAQLDESLMQFLNAFNPQTVPRSGLTLPPVFPYANSPLSYQGPPPSR